jgi:hypothetical protein
MYYLKKILTILGFIQPLKFILEVEMNNKNKACGNCCHFDDQHNMCPKFTVRYPLGKVYLTRFRDSQICRTEYLSKPEVLEDSLSNLVELKN